ncbi:uncharacterized protein LOC142358345 isoform X3 [Convolutriloba macropyga]|uniref:uncharacterized protein LOC142358345 isoform X3 n=1 Tax=Convolutriloba macropyga TaxID=536237 RepID=UPI003F522365
MADDNCNCGGSDACASASDQQGSNPNTQSGIDSYSIVMTENYHPATYTFGTIDCVAIALNVISIIYFPKLSNVLNSEIIILMFTLLALSLVSLSLFVIKLFDLVQTSIRENLYLMTMFAPVCYHIVVPAILMKAAAFFDKGYKSSVNVYLYSGVCVFSIFHIVMIISPANEVFDYKKAGTQHTSHEGLHMSMSTPLLLLVGAVPQFLGTVLMLRISVDISKAAKASRALMLGGGGSSEEGGGGGVAYKNGVAGSVGGNLDYTFGVDYYIKQLVRSYFIRWSWMTAVVVFPSFFISLLSFCLFLKGSKTPHYCGYFQATCDSLIFFTQPLNLTILWLSLIFKHLPPKHKHGKSPLMNGGGRDFPDSISATTALSYGGPGQLSRATSIKYLPLSSGLPSSTSGIFVNTMPVSQIVAGGVPPNMVCPTPPPGTQFQQAGKFGVSTPGSSLPSAAPQGGVYMTENGNYTLVPVRASEIPTPVDGGAPSDTHYSQQQPPTAPQHQPGSHYGSQYLNNHPQHHSSQPHLPPAVTAPTPTNNRQQQLPPQLSHPNDSGVVTNTIAIQTTNISSGGSVQSEV